MEDTWKKIIAPVAATPDGTVAGSVPAEPAPSVTPTPPVAPTPTPVATRAVSPIAATLKSPAPAVEPVPNPEAAKRALVMHRLRSSPEGTRAFARQLRLDYPDIPKDASDQEILRANYGVVNDEMGGNVTPQEWEKALLSTYGQKVDRHLLGQERTNYPGYPNDTGLINRLYEARKSEIEQGPIGDTEKVDIVKRHWPEMVDSPMNTNEVLKLKYEAAKKAGNAGDYQEWLSRKAAPMFREKAWNVAKGFGLGLAGMVKDVGQAGAAVAQPENTALNVGAALTPGENPAKTAAIESLKSAGKGAVDVGAMAMTGPLAAGLKAAEVAPALAGAAEGGLSGAAMGAGNAAIEGQSPMDILKAAGTMGTMGMIPGAIGGHVLGRASVEAADAAAKAAETPAPGTPPTPAQIVAQVQQKGMGEYMTPDGTVAVISKNMGDQRADFPWRVSEIGQNGPITHHEYQSLDAATKDLTKFYAVTGDATGVVDKWAQSPEWMKAQAPILDVAAQARQQHAFADAIQNFATDHGMDVSDVARLTEGDRPALTDLAAANQRYGVTADQIDQLRALKSVVPAPAVPETGAMAPAGPIPTEQTASAQTVSPPTPPESQSPPPAATVPGSVKSKLAAAMEEARGQLAERARLRRQQLSQRLGASRAAFEEAGGGLEGAKASFRAMAGKLNRPDWKGVEFTPEEVNQLHDAIGNADLMEGDKLSARAGLMRLLSENKMGAPNASQLDAMNKAFGSDFVTALTKNTPAKMTLTRAFMRTLNSMRTAMSTGDVSVALRQGYNMMSRPEYWKNVHTIFQGLGTKYADAVSQGIKEMPLYDVMDASGVHFQGRGFDKASETFADAWIENAPVVKQAQSSFDTFLNKTRADVFTSIYGDMEKAGIDVTDPHFRQSLAKLVNTATGRGDVKVLGRMADGLNAVMFSPRLAWSRVETFNPGYYMSLHPALRATTLRMNGAAIGGAMSVLGAMTLASKMVPGMKVGWDPRSADWGKVNFRNTRYDLLAGHGQIMRLAAQMWTGKMVSSTTGREIDLNGSDSKNGFARAGMTRADIFSRFMEAKSAPIASLALAIMRGVDFQGNPVSIPNEILSRFTPMFIEDIRDAITTGGGGGSFIHGIQNGGLTRGAVTAPLALLGLGIQTYGPTLPKAAGGSRQPNYAAVYSTGQWLWDAINGNIEPTDELSKRLPALADQWVGDAAMAQVKGAAEARDKAGFFEMNKADQQVEIRKAQTRWINKVNKLYKDRSGADGEDRRLNAEKNLLERRAQATGMDIEALRHPEVNQ